MTIHGAYSATDSTINLHNRKFTVVDGATTLTGDVIINTTVNSALDFGSIDASTQALNFANNIGGTNTITLNIDARAAILAAIADNTPLQFINAGAVNVGALQVFVAAGAGKITIQDTTAGGNVATTNWVYNAADPIGTLRFKVAAPIIVPAPIVPVPVVDPKKVAIADKAVAELPKIFADATQQFADFQTAADKMVDGPEYDALVTKAAKKLDEIEATFTATTPDDKKLLEQTMAKFIKATVYENAVSPLEYNTVQYDATLKKLAERTTTNASAARIDHMLSNIDESSNFAPTAIAAAVDKAVIKEDKQHKTVAATVTSITQHATNAVNAAVTGATTRLISVAPTLSAPMNVPSVDVDLEASASGVAAGSGYDKFGAWAQVTGSVANQKARKGASGFKSNMIGSMIGVDTMVNDRTILGVAFGNVINNVKQKDIQAGDKTRSSSLIFSGYGNYQFDKDWFVRGAVAYTKTAVDNKDLRTVGATQGIARGKYNIHSFGGELTVGKALKMQNDFIMIPSVGARFAHTGKISYQETGGTGLNNKISQGATDSAQAVAGLQLMKSFVNNGVIITPEAHANVAYGLGAKTPKGTYFSQLDAKTVAYRGNKPSRLSSTIGFGVTAESGSVEYGVGYDANIAAGYLGHQGSLKLKVKF